MSSRSATWPMSISATCSTTSRADPRHPRDPALCRGHHPRPQVHVGGARRGAGQAGAGAEGRAFARRARGQRPRTPACWPAATRVYDAAFRRAGMLRVGTMAELFDAAETLALTARAGRRPARDPDQWRRRRRAGRRCARGGRRAARRHCRRRRSSGSTGCCRRLGAAATRSTLSATRPASVTRPRSKRCSPIPGSTRSWSSTARRRWPSPREAARAVVDSAVAGRTRVARPQHLHRLARRAFRGSRRARRFNAARIPTYETPEAAVTGFLHRVRYQRNQALLMETPPARPDPFEPDVRAVDRSSRSPSARGDRLARSRRGRDRARRLRHSATARPHRRRSRAKPPPQPRRSASRWR